MAQQPDSFGAPRPDLDQVDVGGTNQDNEFLGTALAVGDFDRDGVGDLAIGVPQQNSGIALGAGEVFITHRLDPHWIFGDGFDGQGTGFWSASVP